MSRRFVALFAAVAVSAPALADQFENPLYTSWAKVKEGTVVTQKMTSEVAGQKSENVMTYKLVSLKNDVATVEMVSVTKAGGQEFKSEPIKIENKKMIDLPPGKKKEDVVKPEGQVGEGEETLKIGGKDYKAKWVKTKISKDGMEFESKTWSNDDVPGLMLKMESKASGPGFTSTTTMELVEVKVP
jgi:hypothetical protein